MKNNRFVLLIVGKSGSGKSALCNYMEKTYGLKQVKSYTTRLCRGLEDNTHTFVTDEEFDKLTDMCAYTVFDGNRYCATSKQVDECDLYVIDPAGIDKNVHNHSFRHMFATCLLDNSVPIEQIQLCMGHSDISVTTRYARIRNERDVIRNVMDMEVF